MSDPGNTAERMRGHEAWILIRRILAAPSPDVERHHIDAARDWLTRQRTLPDDFLRDGEMLRSVRAVAAGAGDPPREVCDPYGNPLRALTEAEQHDERIRAAASRHDDVHPCATFGDDLLVAREMLAAADRVGAGDRPPAPQPDEFFKGWNPGWVQLWKEHEAKHPTPPGGGTWEQAYRHLALAVDDMPDTCDDNCNSYGHSEACGAKQSAWPAEEIVRLRAALGDRPPAPSDAAIAAYWRAWSLTPLAGGERDNQESHLAGLKAAYAVDFPRGGGPS